MPENKPNMPDDIQRDTEAAEEIRVGVYTCQCGGNISDTFSCDKVAGAMEGLPNVVVSRTHMAMCSDIGQKMIEADIKEKGLNRIVVGACAPSLHEETFRTAVARAGLNPYLFYHVGLREQNSWVHKHDSAAALDKAMHLMNTGIAKARELKPLEPIELSTEKHTLVIGAGVAGLKAALNIARRGIPVTLIEKTPFLGGHMAQLEEVFPTEESARTGLHALIESAYAHALISIHTCTELTAVSGYIGAYQLSLRKTPRGVTAEIDLAAAADICPITVPDEYNYGLSERKAVYLRYPDCIPQLPAIDWEHCNLCGKCAANQEHINLDNTPELMQLQVGAIVVATGFDPYEPAQGEYGYGELPQVITLPQFIRLQAMQAEDQPLTFNGQVISNMAVIHCVGSRQKDGIHTPQPDGNVNDYCSRVCCTATMHVTNEVKKHSPDIHIFDLYQDIRTYGHGHEEYYNQAASDGVVFLRFKDDGPPVVLKAGADDSQPVLVQCRDTLTWDEELEIPVDLVVLATGMMPAPITDLQGLLKSPPGVDRFMAEVHPKLRPVETAVPGVILAGTCQGPMNILESCAAASAAATKIAILLGSGSVELDPFVAVVDEQKCDGQGACVEACCYEDAIQLETRHVNGADITQAVVTPANCSGCGICVSVCPNRAIDVQGWTLNQYYEMLDAIVIDMPVLEVTA